MEQLQKKICQRFKICSPCNPVKMDHVFSLNEMEMQNMQGTMKISSPCPTRPEIADPEIPVVYSFEACPFVQRVLIVAAFKKIPVIVIPIDVVNKPNWFVEMHPTAKTPYVEFKGLTFVESLVIMELLDESFGGSKLYPQDPISRAITKMFISLASDKFTPALYGTLIEQDPDAMKEKYYRFIGVWKELNSFILKYGGKDGPFLLGKEFSAGDAALAPFIQRVAVLEYYRYFQLPKTPEFARVREFRDAILSHPIVIATCHSREDLIKLYLDHHLGPQKKCQNGLGFSSLDVSKCPTELRSLPRRPLPPPFLLQQQSSSSSSSSSTTSTAAAAAACIVCPCPSSLSTSNYQNLI